MQQTHDLTYTDTTVTKVYRSWDRGEPDREWAALTLLAQHAPGLAPDPLERHEVDGRPAVTMSRLPGGSLGDGPLSHAQAAAAAEAVRRVHAVPVDAVAAVLPERTSGPETFPAQTRSWLDGDPDLAACRDQRLVAAALEAARAWLCRPPTPQAPDVLAMADGNLANFLWDGERCRVVDLEDSGTSERAYEMADHVEHITFRLVGRGDPEAFVRTAGLPPERWARWTSYRPLFACFWLMMLLPGHPGWRRNPPGSLEDQSRHLLGLLGVA